MLGEKFTAKVIHGLNVAKRHGDGRLYCQQCKVPLDMERGDCTACNDARRKWRDARIQHYTDARHPQTLAQMVVELEDSHSCVPEFAFEEEWPT